MEEEDFIMPPPPPRARRVVLRIRLAYAWTPEEDATLRRLVKENGFRRWSRVAQGMPRRRSARACRDRWRRHLAPLGDDVDGDHDLLRRHRYRLGDERWREISRAVHGLRISSRALDMRLRRCWRELRPDPAGSSGFVPPRRRRPLPAAGEGHGRVAAAAASARVVAAPSRRRSCL